MYVDRSNGMKKVFFGTVFIVFLFFGVGTESFPDGIYTVIPLDIRDFHPEQEMSVFDINNRGQVLFGSSSQTYIWTDHNANWQMEYNEIMILFNPLFGSIGVDINNKGNAIGMDIYYSLPEGSIGLFWVNGDLEETIRFRDLSVSVLNAINDHDQIVGDLHLYSGHGTLLSRSGFLWQNSKEIPLSTPSIHVSTASDINNQGQIVGTSSLGPYIWQDQNDNQISDEEDFWDLDVPFTPSFINDNGCIIGMGSDTKTIYLFQDHNQNRRVESDEVNSLNQNTDFLLIGISGFNNRNQVVGNLLYKGNEPYHAFILREGEIIDLNTVITPVDGLQISWAKAINDNGWILCDGYLKSGIRKAFLLIPNPESGISTAQEYQ